MINKTSFSLLLLASAGCSTIGGADDVDQRFAAGWRPSKADCVFGGAAPQTDAYCARLDSGGEGALTLLRAVNESVLGETAGGALACTDHVAIVKMRLAAYGDEYQAQELYSCDRDAPVVDGRKACHVSLLVVEAATGSRFVVDNGYVLNSTVSGGVGTYAEFSGRVAYAWTGKTPHWVALGSN